ncbi:MAG: glycosyltransferase, partial [Lachnospiraceae bacterium]|nr:glycosyltransferase [Lachnospiraceae bacterium]
MEYDIDELLEKKRVRREREGKISLLWAGRFMELKHPEHAIEAAARLKQEGYHFSLTMVGGGELAERLRMMAQEKNVEEEVVFAGFQKPEEVRVFMEQADIFLFTSDYREGWGAVLNEAMNSGCAVVANCAVGAVP